MRGGGFFVFITIIIIANVIKKIMENLQADQQRKESLTPAGTSQSHRATHDMSAKDDFLREFQKMVPSATNRSLHAGDALHAKISAERNKEKKVFSEKMPHDTAFSDYKPSKKKAKRAKVEDYYKIGVKDDRLSFKIDISRQSILSAFVMSEILSPPIALRNRDKERSY